jgi:hypothetical protein
MALDHLVSTDYVLAFFSNIILAYAMRGKTQQERLERWFWAIDECTQSGGRILFVYR